MSTIGKKTWILALLSLLLGAAAVFAQQDDPLLGDIDEALDEDIEEILDLGRSGDPDSEDIHRDLDVEGGTLEVSQATSSDNPLLTSECEKAATRRALEEMMEHKNLDMEGAIEMGKMHMHERRQAIEENGITYADYIAHVAECKAFCRPMVKEMLGCHVEAVSSLPHDIVFFDFNSSDIRGFASRNSVRSVAEQVIVDEQKNILLIGRASRVGPKGYNRRLSNLRARSVADALMERGVDDSRIRILTFGYEPPQISEEIARAYDVYDIYLEEGSRQVNQSVMMVVY